MTQLITRQLRGSGVFTGRCHLQRSGSRNCPGRWGLFSQVADSVEASRNYASRPRDANVVLRRACVECLLWSADDGGPVGERVEAGTSREFGRADVSITAANPLFDDDETVGSQRTVWMSHDDHVAALLKGFEVMASSKGAALYTVIADEARQCYGDAGAESGSYQRWRSAA